MGGSVFYLSITQMQETNPRWNCDRHVKAKAKRLPEMATPGVSYSHGLSKVPTRGHTKSKELSLCLNMAYKSSSCTASKTL